MLTTNRYFDLIGIASPIDGSAKGTLAIVRSCPSLAFKKTARKVGAPAPAAGRLPHGSRFAKLQGLYCRRQQGTRQGLRQSLGRRRRPCLHLFAQRRRAQADGGGGWRRRFFRRRRVAARGGETRRRRSHRR